MRRLAWFAGGFCAMTAAFVCGLAPAWCMALVLLCTAASAVTALRSRKLARRAAVAALGLCLGLGWCWLDWQRNVLPLDQFDGRTLPLSATAMSAGRQNGYGVCASVEFELEGRTCQAVLYSDAQIELFPGDRVTGMMRLRRTGALLGEDSLSFAARGTDFRLFVQGSAEVSSPEKLPLRCMPAAFSERLKERLAWLLPDPERGFETALLTGDRDRLSDEIYGDMALAGTRHIVAVSGMHISILVGLLLLLLGRRRLTVLLAMPLLVFYGFCVGMTPSVVRALVMQALLLLAPVLRRENDPPTSLLAALMLILLPNPRAILDVGLQLSFASAAGILLLSRRVFDGLWGSKWCKALRRGPRFLSTAVKTVLSGVAASVSVIPLSMPLQLLYFELFSLAGPLSAALLVPLLSLLLALGFLALVCSAIWYPLGQAAAYPLRWLIRWCLTLNHGIASIPFAAISTRNPYLLIFLLGLYVMVVWRLLDKRPCSPWLCGSCLAGLFALCLLFSALERDRGQLSLTMLDVGQGQCVFLRSGNRTALYDCGGDGDPAETATQFLQGNGRHGVDFLVLSHYDRDHTGGVLRLLQRVPVGTIFLPEEPDEAGIQTAILSAAQELRCPVCFVTEDLTLPFGGGAARLYAPVRGGSDNASSLAALFSAGDLDVLLTGDMDAPAEKNLIYQHDLKDVEILVAGHHGAASSTGPATIHYLQPKIALISAGEGNVYNHPSRHTLDRLGEAGALVYRTDQCGDISVWR